MSFVTRPELKPPKFNVKVYDKDQVSPGYWFVAPYAVIEPEAPSKKWSPCQVGPHIYDGDGMLIWSGACLFPNRNIFDFKVTDVIDGQQSHSHLSFILQHAYNNDQTEEQSKGAGLILNGHYEHEAVVPVTNDLDAFNMHEFNVLDGGKTALACTYRTEVVDFAALGLQGQSGRVVVGGFEEIDVATGKVLFEWKSSDHVPLSESDFSVPESPAQVGSGWDYIHVNSVDKNADGDYLLSARFTNTIYLISGKDGHIIWRLGGKRSDFVQDFTFYRQHHARFIESNSTHTIISFLNNASDEGSQREDVSAALYVVLDTAARPMTARVLRRYERPDGGLTRLRGDVQTLPNGNVFVGWSQQGYHSEFTPNGSCVMEARFASDRFSTYRAYKFDFVGRPSEPPVLKAAAYGSTASDLTTIIYVSWNGATEVAAWNFYARADSTGPSVKIGTAAKSGFETMFVADGYMDWVSADAIDAEGNILGTSEVVRTSVPEEWFASQLPVPDYPMAYEAVDSESADSDKSIDWTSDVLAPIGAFTLLVLFTGILVGTGASLFRVIQEFRTQTYTEVPDDDRFVESTEMA
ncbi:hypothetical protein VTN77DRAFT_9312 [Rasamsonia byssochlamydoides]|uniref:uncharacterized protein n=1 Tax=Rasamsonia byssochlamydoides TaxID=89139 RepID=UPI00374436CB